MKALTARSLCHIGYDRVISQYDRMKRSFRRRLDGADAGAVVQHGHGSMPGTRSAHPGQRQSGRDRLVIFGGMDPQAVIWREFPGDGLDGLQVTEQLSMPPRCATIVRPRADCV